MLIARITSTCDLNIPSTAVAEEEVYGEQVRVWVPEQVGLEIDFVEILAVGHVRFHTEDGT